MEENNLSPDQTAPYGAFGLLGLRFYIPVNSFGHVETVSSTNHTFSRASLTKCTVPMEQSDLGPNCLQYRLPGHRLPKNVSRQLEQTTEVMT